MSEIERWLEELGLVAYAPAFAAHHIEFDLLADLGDEDLKQLGVEALGHRKRLLRAIAAFGVDALPVPLAAKLPAPTSSLRDAERRQLTVMFCDLVGSTVLARELDPEDLQRVMLDYHACVTAAVVPYAGHVARFLGDGVLVYFGFPQAHEDDAARAVRAALSVLAAVRQCSSDRVLQARIGIATGQVVIGEVGAGTAAAEHAASGETPNLAARLQAQAQPGETVLSAETRELLGEAFELESLGSLDLKGFGTPIEAWRVARERRVASRFEAQHMLGLGAFVGRDSEIGLLLERWTLAREGEGQALLLSGDAGLGKSRICQSLRERLAGESTAMVLLQCSPYFSSSALYPMVQHLERTAGIVADDVPALRAEKIEKLAGALPSALLGSLLRLMGLPDGGRSLSHGASPQEEKAHTLEALIELLHRLALEQPVLFLVEDAHWIDPTTEELLGQLVQQLRERRLLILVTCRPQYEPAWGGAAPLTQHSLTRLLREGYTGWLHFGGTFFSTGFAGDAAEVLLDAGLRSAAAEFVDTGEKIQLDTEESFQAARFVWLRGRFAELDGHRASAETAYREAIVVADGQGAMLFALRAATSLSRLLNSQGRLEEADVALRPTYSHFTEGLDWPDLISAKVELDRFARSTL